MPNTKTELQGRVRFSIYIAWPSALILNNFKLHQKPLTQKQFKTFVWKKHLCIS